MRIKGSRKLALFGVAAASAMLVAPAAVAGTTANTRVDMNGVFPEASSPGTFVHTVDVNGFNDGSLDFLTDLSGIDMSCNNADVDGTIEWGEDVVANQQIGAITNLDFQNCAVLGGSLPVVVANNPGSWPITVRNTPASAGDPVDITIHGISAYMHSTGSTPWACELDATGDVDGTFYPGTTANGHDGRIVIDTPSSGTNMFPLGVTPYDGSGTKTPAGTTCVLITAADGVSMTGAFEMDVVSGQTLGGNAISGPISHH